MARVADYLSETVIAMAGRRFRRDYLVRGCEAWECHEAWVSGTLSDLALAFRAGLGLFSGLLSAHVQSKYKQSETLLSHVACLASASALTRFMP